LGNNRDTRRHLPAILPGDEPIGHAALIESF
jgi:hypothetical protein